MLTLQQMQKTAPSIFATEPWQKMNRALWRLTEELAKAV